MQLSKTDFIQYLNCPESLWALKHDPDNYPHGEFPAFTQKLTREGYEVECYVQEYFRQNGRQGVCFQAVFKSNDGLFARVDVLEKTSKDEVILYEIKSSNKVSTDSSHNHVKDACFQKICAERAGQKIDRVYIVHLNGSYVRNGDVDPTELLIFADVTNQVDDMLAETEEQIDAALCFLSTKRQNIKGCTCLQKSRTNHCDTFSIFNPNIPSPSIYSLPRLSAKKRAGLVNSGIFDLLKIPDGYSLSANQQKVVLSAKGNIPQVNRCEIRDFLSDLHFPLHFFDYETYASAVPLIDRASPHKHFPVQFSLHILDDDGTFRHEEFLEREARLPERLLSAMQTHIGDSGSIVSWHASFEKTQNREMARLFPESADFLNDLNERMVDLEDLFKSAYVDVQFDGSTSIKKVLPVICPALNYSDLEVQDGASAMVLWKQMHTATPSDADEIAQTLLAYCKRDTLALVKIYRFLKSLI